MAYIECKVWHFQGDDDMNQKSRHKAMEAGCRHYTVKALIDTSSKENFIRRSLVDKLEMEYTEYKGKNRLGCLELSFRYKGKDRLVDTNGDDVLNDFMVIEKPKADLVLGLPWLWLREAEIDIWKEGIKIYGDFVPFCKETDSPEKGKDSPAPVQDNQLLNEFFETYTEYKAYKSLSGPELRKAEMKKAFFRGLNQESKTHPSYEEPPDPFKRLSEILVKLDVPHDLRLEILFGSDPNLIRCLENMREGNEHLS